MRIGRARPARAGLAPAALAGLILASLAAGTAGGGDSNALALLARANAARTQHGRPPLIINERLAQVAQAHAEDMAAQGALSHEGSEGARLDARLARAGYRYRFAAENIAAGPPDPAGTVARWMESRDHRGNLLEATATEAGIGHAEAARGGTDAEFRSYWVLILARPL